MRKSEHQQEYSQKYLHFGTPQPKSNYQGPVEFRTPAPGILNPRALGPEMRRYTQEAPTLKARTEQNMNICSTVYSTPHSPTLILEASDSRNPNTKLQIEKTTP